MCKIQIAYVAIDQENRYNMISVIPEHEMAGDREEGAKNLLSVRAVPERARVGLICRTCQRIRHKGEFNMNQDQEMHEDLERGLKNRHIQLIGLGGAIGVGLFLGSATAIELAGPSVLLTYIIGGIAIYFIMRALGELSVAYPVSGAFSAHAARFLGPKWGYLTGWTYWYMWMVTCMAELTAVGIYMNFWYPELPQWVSALAALVIMTVVNFIAVSAYGEFEFWFALIKICTIIFMIISGAGMIFFGLGNDGIATGIANLWSNGGFFPNGIDGTLMALVMVMYSYLGIEIIGVTAGEAHDPKKTIKKAIDEVFWRILIFYVMSLAVIMSIYPWNEIGHMGSPFVITFEKLGIRGAADIINLVVISAVLSSCNSGIFSSGRMLYNLSLQGNAPQCFQTLNRHRLPWVGILFSAFILLLAVGLNYVMPKEVFVYVTSIGSFGALWTWFVILRTQQKFRASLSTEEKAQLTYKMPGAPYTGYLTMAFLACVVVASAFREDTRVALFVTPVWFIILLLGYTVVGKNKNKGGSKVVDVVPATDNTKDSAQHA